MKKRLLFLPLLLLLWCSGAWGAYYIDADVNGKSAGSGTITDPYTAEDAVTWADSLDLYFKQDAPSRSVIAPNTGTSGDPVYLQGYKWANITKLSEQSIAGITGTHGIYVFSRTSKTYLVIGLQIDGLKIYDVTDPSAVTLKYSYDDNARTSFMHGDFQYSSTADCLYAAGREGGVYIFDLSNAVTGHDLANGDMADADMVNRIASPNSEKVTGLWLDATNDILYAAERKKGWFGVLNAVTNPTACTASASIHDISNYEVHRICGANNPDGDSKNYVYLPNFEGVTIHDVTDLTTPTIIRTATMYNYTNTWDMEVRGNLLYTSHTSAYSSLYDSAGLWVIDVSNKYMPFIVGRWEETDFEDYGADRDSPPYEIHTAGNYIIMSSGANGTRILDVKNPQSPTLFMTIPVSTTYSSDENYGATSCDAYDDKIYVAYSDGYDFSETVSFAIYQVHVETDVPWEAAGTEIQAAWRESGTSANLIDDYFNTEIATEYDGGRFWTGGSDWSSATITISSNNDDNASSSDGAHLRYSIQGATTKAYLRANIQAGNAYYLSSDIAITDLGDLTGANFLSIYFLKWIDPTAPDTGSIDNVRVIGDISADASQIRWAIRYYTDDTNYSTSSYSGYYDIGETFHTFAISYLVQNAVGNEVTLDIDGVSVAAVDVDTSTLTKKPNCLQIYVEGAASASNPIIVDTDELHYNTSVIDDSVTTANLWVAACDAGDNDPQHLWYNGTLGKEEANTGNCNVNGDWYHDSSTSPDTLYFYYDSGDPDTVFTEPGIEIGSLSSIITLSASRQYVYVDKAYIYGARSSAVSATGASNCDNDYFRSCEIAYSLNGVSDSANGPIYYYNVLSHHSKLDGWDYTKGDGKSSVMRNCGSYLNSAFQADAGLTGTGTVDHQYCGFWDGSGEDLDGLTLDATDVNTNPQFWNATSGDYRLKWSSPWAGAGTYLGIEYRGSNPQLQGWTNIGPYGGSIHIWPIRRYWPGPKVE